LNVSVANWRVIKFMVMNNFGHTPRSCLVAT